MKIIIDKPRILEEMYSSAAPVAPMNDTTPSTKTKIENSIAQHLIKHDDRYLAGLAGVAGTVAVNNLVNE